MHKFVVRFVMVAVLLASPAFAADVVLSWDMSTVQNEDGVRVMECSSASCAVTPTQKAELPPDTATHTLTGVADGTHYYMVYAFKGTTKSANSNVLTLIVNGLSGGPTNLTGVVQ